MSDTFTIWVPGEPKPQGSKRHVGGGVMVESSKKLKPWRQAIGDVARRYWIGPPWEGPILSRFKFMFARPKGHYGSRKGAPYIRESSPRLRDSTPDIEKLRRAVADALAGVCYGNDSHLAYIIGGEGKFYTDTGHQGVLIELVKADYSALVVSDTSVEEAYRSGMRAIARFELDPNPKPVRVRVN